MASLPVKIPAKALERLQAHAARRGCNRSALTRDILMRWLEAEEQATCQATLKTEPLPTPKTEPPLGCAGTRLSEWFRPVGGDASCCSWVL
ncbi:MAG: ribbon-helix-helix protein, CopG family [Cyanobacteria bacterium REEB498]|nr:ribbon-helix-helix protein, CopG family [Cyanobacteria bacterium REEB498]